MLSIADDEIAPLSDVKLMRALYLRLLRGGCTKEEASNIVATLVGLQISPSGWTLKQIENILFISKISRDVPP